MEIWTGVHQDPLMVKYLDGNRAGDRKGKGQVRPFGCLGLGPWAWAVWIDGCRIGDANRAHSSAQFQFQMT